MAAVTSRASDNGHKPQMRRGALWIEKRLHLDTRYPEPLKDIDDPIAFRNFVTAG